MSVLGHGLCRRPPQQVPKDNLAFTGHARGCRGKACERWRHLGKSTQLDLLAAGAQAMIATWITWSNQSKLLSRAPFWAEAAASKSDFQAWISAAAPEHPSRKKHFRTTATKGGRRVESPKAFCCPQITKYCEHLLSCNCTIKFPWH